VRKVAKVIDDLNHIPMECYLVDSIWNAKLHTIINIIWPQGEKIAGMTLNRQLQQGLFYMTLV